MENSFSLQFNKMTQLKTAQEYEKEIEKLQTENWEIKHQLAYLKSNPVTNLDDNIQKLLYDSKTSIDILENENKNFQKQIDHMKEIIRINNQEKDKLRNDLEDQNNKINNIEEENQRLITHIENMKNKYENIYQEHKTCEEKFNELNITYNNNLLNLQNDKMTYFKEGEKLLKENEELKRNLYEERNNLINLNNEYKIKLMTEEKEYEEKIKNLTGSYKETDLYIKELQKTLNKETRDKQNLALENEDIKRNIKDLNFNIENLNKELQDKNKELENKNKMIENNKVELENNKIELENINKKMEIIENEKRAMKYKMKNNEYKNYELSIREINKCKEYVDKLTNKLKTCLPKKDTVEFLNSLNIKSRNLNCVVKSFRNIFGKMKDKIEILRRETHDLNKFNKNEKLMKIVQEFAVEFKNAKSDLNATKEYLEKKNAEIKEIKKEKNGIQKMYENLLHKYNRTSFKL
ncbi:uncharacterized protein VNE69_03145 [Vairimorpha necatrix]|uniref:Uncharacterized protein n=1 Tax=Vairimorpha necatrix TaxID=6039 RepID=A0AAX4JAJ8_9MICR